MKTRTKIYYAIPIAVLSMFLAIAIGCETSNAPFTTGASFSGGKSPMLEKVERVYEGLKTSNSNESQRFDIFSSIWNAVKSSYRAVVSWAKDAADVAGADIAGFAEGSAKGAMQGAVLEAAGVEGATLIGAAVGGITGGACASADAYDDLDKEKGQTGDNKEGSSGDGGSSEGGAESNSGGGIVVRRPAVGPYGNMHQPMGMDSIGWLHNEAVIYLLTNKRSGSVSDYQQMLRKWAIEARGYSPQIVEAVTSLEVLAPILNSNNYKGSFENYPDQLRNKGLVVEGDYLAALNNEIKYLFEQKYDFPSVLDLVRAYRDNAATLNLPTDRKLTLQRQLTVYMYSLALWDANGK